MDFHGMTFACATRTEERAARKLGVPTALVGIGARRPLPDGPLVSFGLAGGLHEELQCGEVLDATRVVDAEGALLWEGEPLGVDGARPGTILAVDGIVDDPEERRRLHDHTGADAIDMESGALARSGRLAGCLRAISDTPGRPLGPLTEVMDANGNLRPGGIARALADVHRALVALQQLVTRPEVVSG